MKKSIVSLLLCLVLTLGCFTASIAEAPDKSVPGAIVLPASEATFTTDDKGISFDNKKTETVYDAEHDYIINIAKDGEVTFTVPEGVEGEFDIYLTVSKIIAQFTSQPFCFSINGGEPFSVPIDCEVYADSPVAFHRDGDADNLGEWYDDGRFLVIQNVTLKAGDTVSVIGSFGAKSASYKGKVFPGVRELTLAPAGTPVATGYDYTIETPVDPDPNDPLSGLNIIWIGSSVTYGACSSGHYSMVDAIQDNHPGTVCEKYAINATTLVNQSEDSYVSRLKLIPKDKKPDLVVVQLSTNDATANRPFGEIAEGTDAASFDDTTIAGAIETIIAYVQETFGCPVAFYTGSYTVKENYAEMVQLLLDIQKKWNIGVVDMFNNEDMTAIYDTEQYHAYMDDEVHPKKIGYVEWWTPVIEKELAAFMAQQ